MTEKTVKVSQDIIDMARGAKSFVSGSGEDALPDELLMRAAVTFNMLLVRGMVATVRHDDLLCKPHDFDDFDRAHAIALIASNFSDSPPSTPERAVLFATALPDDYAAALHTAVAGNRRAIEKVEGA